jgi:hypothetical protein
MFVENLRMVKGLEKVKRVKNTNFIGNLET